MGRLLLCIAMVCAFFPGIYLVATGARPSLSLFLKAFTPMFLSWFIIWCIEPISYYPILGLSGSFISWLSGNILNLRIPCSVLAQQVAEVEEGTEEGDVISTIGLCVSVFINLVIVFIFALAGTQILAVMPAGLKESFNYMLPAIMGSMMMNFAARNFKVAGMAVVFTLICNLIHVSSSINMLFIVFPTIAVALFLNSRSKNKEDKAK